MEPKTYRPEDFDAFDQLAAPWKVDERLRREVPVLTPSLLTGGNGFLLKDLIEGASPDVQERKTQDALARIWGEIEKNAYSRYLTANPHYAAASQSFERKLLKVTGEKDKIRRRIRFRYFTGFYLHILPGIACPVRLVPDKDTADRVMNHIDALLADMRGENEWAYWADYRMQNMLRELRKKMEATKTVQRVPNSLSPANFLVFSLTQRFIEDFGEPMQAILSDLCRVMGSTPDDSTVSRWVTSAIEYQNVSAGLP